MDDTSPHPMKRNFHVDYELMMKALTQLAKITKPGGFSIHAIKYEVNFDDEELEQIGFRRIDDPDERILILQRLPENPGPAPITYRRNTRKAATNPSHKHPTSLTQRESA